MDQTWGIIRAELYKFETVSHRGLLNFQYFIKYHDLGKISIIVAIKTKIYNRNYFRLLTKINYDGHFNSNLKLIIMFLREMLSCRMYCAKLLWKIYYIKCYIWMITYLKLNKNHEASNNTSIIINKQNSK